MGWLIFLALVIMLAAWGIGTYNAIIWKKNSTDNAWAQIDVQLKRRHDVIPNLVETAKGYMGHERETLEKVIQARTQATQATAVKEKESAENFLTSTLRSLFAVVEQYPDLKANQNMLRLQEELTSTENRIAFARQYYNDEVMRFNTYIEQVPAVFLAQMFGFGKKDLFQVESLEEKKAPQVKF
ncbi:MAG: LemA family protein [Candidatus Omnitrophica bacterium]|nr:LemA family protein [Candidatus Omnitrophota bacterium]